MRLTWINFATFDVVELVIVVTFPVIVLTVVEGWYKVSMLFDFMVSDIFEPFNCALIATRFGDNDNDVVKSLLILYIFTIAIGLSWNEWLLDVCRRFIYVPPTTFSFPTDVNITYIWDVLPTKNPGSLALVPLLVGMNKPAFAPAVLDMAVSVNHFDRSFISEKLSLNCFVSPIVRFTSVNNVLPSTYCPLITPTQSLLSNT